MTSGRDYFIERFQPSTAELEGLDAYVEVLNKWNPRINLVAPASLSNVWTRHILDSAQLFESHTSQACKWIDLGSGGGFPGAVVAVMASGRSPSLRVKLVESDQRKAAFLRAVSRETAVPFEVISSRVENVQPEGADIVSARALAPLSLLLEYSNRHLAPGGKCLFLKGETLDDELPAALAKWQFTYQKEQSLSHPSGVVLSIGDLRRV